MPLANSWVLGRITTGLAIAFLFLAPAAALAQDEELEYKGFPRLQGGGWDIYLDFVGGELTRYSGAHIFSGLGGYDELMEDDDRIPALFSGGYRILNSAPGRITWEIRNKAGAQRAPMSALFLSSDVAIAVRRVNATEQTIYMVRTPCDFRYSDTPSPEIEGCSWMRMSDSWLEHAYLTGECSLGSGCFRLVSDMFMSYYPSAIGKLK
jgi:hypothetical protein